MRWVKTSEQLPEIAGYYFVRWDNGDKTVYKFRADEKYDNLTFEWLDESPQDNEVSRINSMPDDEDGYWEQRCKAAEEILRYGHFEISGPESDVFTEHWDNHQLLKSKFTEHLTQNK